MPLVEVLALPGVLASGVALTLDIFATANRLREAGGRPAPFAIRLSGGGWRVAPRAVSVPVASPSERAAVVVLPGLGTATEKEIEERLARRDARRAADALAVAADRGAEIASSCSGTFLLAAAGLLVGRRATTSWWLAPAFRRRHPEVRLDPEALLVRDGRITTAGAALAQVDVALDLVSRHADRALANDCARYLLLDARRSQAAYVALGHLSSADERVAKAERWARRHLADGPTVDEIAAAAGLAPRTFARRVERATGLSPVRFLQRIRVEQAIELLETFKLSVEEVARRVGYAEPSTLRRVLRAAIGVAPGRIKRSRG